jgi:hypothetical protein
LKAFALVLNSIVLALSVAMSLIPFVTAQGPPYPLSFYIPLVMPIGALLNVASLITSPQRFLALHRSAIAVSLLIVLGVLLFWVYIAFFGNSLGRSVALRQAPSFLGVIAMFAVSVVALRRRRAVQHA